MATVDTFHSIRERGWERFRSIPWPVKTDEEWRRTDPRMIPPIPEGSETPAGSLEVGWNPIPPEMIQSGLILTDLETALTQFPELIEEYLFKSGEPEGLAKFAALHQACWKGGLFCYVPDRIKVEIPLKAWGEGVGNGAMLFPHTLVVVGEGSEVTLMEERRGSHSPALSDEMVEIFLKRGAILRTIRLERWGPPTMELLTQRAILEQEAQFLHLIVGLGGRLVKANLETILQGPGARAELLGLFLGSERQHFDVHTLQDHQARNTFSDLLYKSALKDEAEMIYTGLIRIRKDASKSDAYQANRNLLLSQGAKADSIPMLEIETDDVRCTHGVAVGPVDEEQAFYLMSRGIPAGEAEELIVEGFLEQVLKRVPVEELREQLMSQIKEEKTR